MTLSESTVYFLPSLRQIPDTSPDFAGLYVYIFAPCPTVDCSTTGEDSSGVVRISLLMH